MYGSTDIREQSALGVGKLHASRYVYTQLRFT